MQFARRHISGILRAIRTPVAAPRAYNFQRTGLAFATFTGAAALGTAAVVCDDASKTEVKVVSQLPAEWKVSDCSFSIYQYESCPFCRKVRATLDFLDRPYNIVEVHPLGKAELKPFSADYSKVPVLVVKHSSGESVQIRDSSVIVRALLGEKAVAADAGCPLPASTTHTLGMWDDEKPENREGEIESLWVRWADECLVQLIVMNIYRSVEESKETFSYLLTHEKFSWFSKLLTYWSGVFVMRMVASKKCSKFEVQAGREREALYEALNMFVGKLEESNRTFLGGKEPCEADFNVFGVLRSIEKFSTEKDILSNTKMGRWYSAMADRVGDSAACNGGNVEESEVLCVWKECGGKEEEDK